MIGTIEIECQAKNPNMPLWPLRAFVGSPSSIRVRNVPKRVGDWNINRVYVSVIYPDGATKQADCVQTGGVWVGTIEGSAVAGTCAQGYTVYADGTDENGNAVTGYILGKGDVAILQANGTPEPEPATVFVKLQEDGTDAEDGDLYPTENGYAIQQDGEAHLLGTPFDQISAYVESAVSAKADLSAVPTNVSQLSNDSGFITSADVPTKTSELSNDSGYVTSAQIVPSQINAGNASTSDKSLVSQALAEDAADEHSTRVVVDEYGNVILQKYTAGWYSTVLVNGAESQDYWNAVTRVYDYLTDARVVDVLVQDKQRTNNPVVVYTHGTKSETEYTVSADYYGTALSVKAISSDVPMWTNVARLVPDNGYYSGLRSSILYNDSGFITSVDVRPGSVHGNAEQADMAVKARQLVGMNGLFEDVNNILWVPNGVPTLAHYSYYPWYLSQYYESTFDPAIELIFKDWGTISWRVGRRIQQIYVGPAWGSNTVGNERYFLLAETPDEGETYNPSGTLKYFLSGVAPANKTVTFSSNQLSVETIEGESGQIACTRFSSLKMVEPYPLAFESEVSVKADLSSLDSKLDVSAYNGASIEDMGGNSISADRSFVTVTQLSGVWQLSYGATTNTLHGQSKTNMSYYPAEPELGDKRFQLTWGIHSSEYWTLEVYTYNGDWSQMEQYDSEAATSAATALVFPNTSVQECIYEEPRIVETGKLAAQEWVEEQLPTKADLSALNLKQDKLAVAQISAIDSVVDERKTVVKYSDNTTATFDIYGTLNHDDIYIYGNVVPAKVKIGNGVTTIGTQCFQGNTSLTSVEIPDSVSSINSGAFTGTGLATVEIPATVKTLQQAFTHNTNLTSIVLNEGLETIDGSGVLAQCNKLTTLTIPASVTSIAENAFTYLTNISSVVFKEKTPAQVQAMANYPWGITDTSKIKTWNAASQEWVLEQLSALEARIAALEGN